MRKSLMVMVLLTTLIGCVNDKGTVVGSAAWSERLKPKTPDATPNIIELHYIFIERELGDELLQKKIWEDADELVVSLDQKKDWEANGLRVGKLGSRLAPELLKMLESSNPTGEGRRHVTQSGGLVKVQMTDNLPVMKLLSVTGGAPSGEEIADAQGFIQIVTSVAADSMVRIEMMPMIEHGPKANRYLPAPDLSGMQLRTVRETKIFEGLSVKMDVASGEYVLIGRSAGRGSSTLGDNLFVKEIGAKRVETALLVRAIRPSRDALYSAGYDYDDFFLTPIRRSRAAGPSNIRETVAASQRAMPVSPSTITANEL